MKKLELKNLKVKQLTKTEQEKTNGGLYILSIGYACSVQNACTRLSNQSSLYCSDATICISGSFC